MGLAKGLNKDTFDVTVVCLYSGGELTQELHESGVRLISLEKKGRWDVPGFIWRLIRVLRGLEPDILHSYLSVQNLLSVLVKPALPATRVVWGVRTSNMDSVRYEDWLARPTFRLEILLSRFPSLTIFNSAAGREHYSSLGFAGSRTAVIPNGVDTERFSPNARSGARLRALWQIPEGAFLVGIVGRLDPVKDHTTFLRAAALFAQVRPEARFVCIGGGPEKYADELRGLSDKLGLTETVLWPGFILDDLSAAYNALDICTSSSSYGEGTPNVLCEAMACGVPCVVTAVGDSPQVVGETGIIVPPRNPEALAAGWAEMARRTAENPQLRDGARARIESRFSLSALVYRTSEALLNLL